MLPIGLSWSTHFPQAGEGRLLCHDLNDLVAAAVDPGVDIQRAYYIDDLMKIYRDLYEESVDVGEWKENMLHSGYSIRDENEDVAYLVHQTVCAKLLESEELGIFVGYLKLKIEEALAANRYNHVSAGDFDFFGARKVDQDALSDTLHEMYFRLLDDEDCAHLLVFSSPALLYPKTQRRIQFDLLKRCPELSVPDAASRAHYLALGDVERQIKSSSDGLDLVGLEYLRDQ